MTRSNETSENIKMRIAADNRSCYSLQHIKPKCFTRILSIKLYKIILTPLYSMDMKYGP
jgi:hypothetical protein